MRKNGTKQKSGGSARRSARTVILLSVVLCAIAGGCGAVRQIKKSYASKNVKVLISDTAISIENDFIAREYLIKDGHINTSTICNKRIEGGRTLKMQEGSQDFVIRLIDENCPLKKLNKAGWKITIKNGDGTEIPQSEAARLIDESTLIHPQISGIVDEKTPFTVDLDLGREQTIRSFSNEAIISFTNPLDEQQTYALTVDGTVGADKELADAGGFSVHPYREGVLDSISYGDTVTVTLKPHETIIYQYGVVDTKAPSILSARSQGTDEIVVRFDERVCPKTVTVDGKPVEAVLQADYRTLVLHVQESLGGTKQISACVRDMSGNEQEVSAMVVCCKEGDVIAGVADADSLKNAKDVSAAFDTDTEMVWMSGMNQSYEVVTDNELTGRGSFTISTGVQTEISGVHLVTVGDDVALSLDKEGYVEFAVGDVTLTAQANVTTVTQKAYGIFGTEAYVPTQTKTTVLGKVNDGKAHTITAVREENGMLKLYLDGELCASCYEKENLNQELSGGTITVADDKFEGMLAEVRILNRALGYDEVFDNGKEQ